MADAQSAVRKAIEIVPGIPCEREAPVFEEPWQAQAFAMALTLQQQGVFSWHEWAEALGDEIKKALAPGNPDDGSTYYFHWLATLERLVATKGIASSATLQRYYHAWDRAADRTPHGAPIVLEPSDFREAPSDLQSTISSHSRSASDSEFADRAQTYAAGSNLRSRLGVKSGNPFDENKISALHPIAIEK